MSNIYTEADIAKHNSKKSLWVIFNNKVYDVTEFAQDHPGGDDIVLEYAGKDITAIMSDRDSHDHSDSAFEMLEEYLIGTLAVHEADGAIRHWEGQRASIHRRRLGLLEKEAEYRTYTDENFVPSLTDARVDVKAHQFLDLSKPLVPQMLTMKFTRAHYLEQVHKPRYLNRPAEFFGHPLLEPLTKTVWWVVPTLWLPYVIYNLYQSLTFGNTTATTVFFLLGMFIWTFLEYSLHRFLFHYDDRMPENQLMFLLHFVLHGFHHYLPMDRLVLH
jgi:4-hydroxysphinganine ceramide fatty acyl 2-hydroxylase